jgi:hypothetical protein
VEEADARRFRKADRLTGFSGFVDESLVTEEFGASGCSCKSLRINSFVLEYSGVFVISDAVLGLGGVVPESFEGGLDIQFIL